MSCKAMYIPGFLIYQKGRVARPDFLPGRITGRGRPPEAAGDGCPRQMMEIPPGIQNPAYRSAVFFELVNPAKGIFRIKMPELNLFHE